jgi:hypothetical protein
MELDEVPNVDDAMPFPGEDAVIMIYDGCPPSGMRHVSNPSLGTPTRCSLGHEDAGM